MCKRFRVILPLLLLLPSIVRSQIFPKEGSSLNYRIVGFAFPSKSVYSYILQIATGHYTDEAVFEKNISQSLSAKENRVLVELPSFKQQYTWRVVTSENNSFVKGELHHFSTGYIPDVDSNVARLRILTHAEKYKDAYVFLDFSKVLYDMEGHPVWFLPHSANLRFDDKAVRDLKLTQFGTITFVSGGKDAYEINYDGDVLWKAPNNGAVSGDTTEHYNHEFTRLSNGHYMIAGTQYTWLDQPGPAGSPVPPNVPGTPRTNGPVKNPPGANTPQPNPPMPNPGPGNQATATTGDPSKMRHRMNPILPMGTIMEYDEKGNLVWSWKSTSYFRGSDVLNYMGKNNRPISDIHQNSFFFDEKEKVIYASYRNISRVLKIKYPEGTVINYYGETFKPNVLPLENGLFCYQHSVRKSSNGYIYLFNNNACNPECGPQLLLMQEPVTDRDTLKKIWEYDCEDEEMYGMRRAMRSGKQPQNVVPPNADNTNPADQKTKPNPDNPTLSTGGNILEMPDGSIFTSLCTPFSKVFIVNRDKKIMWSAIPERYIESDKKWITEFEYRANIINNRADLEQLIWNSQKK